MELYDLTNDVGETKDVASQNPNVVARMEAYLKTARTESKEFPTIAKPRATGAARTASRS